jgi:hypothetical protein
MKKRLEFPSERVWLDTKDPAIQLIVIDLFRKHGIEVFHDTKSFDPKYPYLLWSYGKLTQSYNEENEKLPLDQFLDHFFIKPNEPITIKLNKEYDAVIDEEGTVVVGCQTIPFSKLEAVYKAALKQKGK